MTFVKEVLRLMLVQKYINKSFHKIAPATLLRKVGEWPV